MALALRGDPRLDRGSPLRGCDQPCQPTSLVCSTSRRRQRVRDLQACDAHHPPLARHLRGRGQGPRVLRDPGRGPPRSCPARRSAKSLLNHTRGDVKRHTPLSGTRAICLCLVLALCGVGLAACGGAHSGTRTIVLWYPKLPGYVVESSTRAVIKAELPLLRSALGGDAKVVTAARGRKRCTASTTIGRQVARTIRKYAGQTVTVSVYGTGKGVRSLCKSLTEKR